MKKLKSILIYVLSLALVVCAAVAGTVAYLTDEDSDVNVMTLGNVKIDQLEFERTDEETSGNSVVIKEFSQAKPLYPAVYANDDIFDLTSASNEATVNFNEIGKDYNASIWNPANINNEVDKFVFVENIGKSDAYVRTWFACELGNLTLDEWKTMVHLNVNASDWDWSKDWTLETVNGKNYAVNCVTYIKNNGVLEAGAMSEPSLLQVALDKNATNETVESFGGVYNIYVLSQAIQTKGFEDDTTYSRAAFRALEEGFGTDIPWTEMKTIGVLSTYEEFKDIRTVHGEYVIGNDVNLDNIVYASTNGVASIDLNNKTVECLNKTQYGMGAQYGGQLVLEGDGTVNMGKGFMTNKDNANITINGGTYIMNQTGTLNSMKHNSVAQNNSSIVINDGTFITENVDTAIFFATSNSVIEVNGGFFNAPNDSTPDYFSMGTNKTNVNRIIFKGGTFVNWNPMEDRMMYTGEWPSNGYEAFSGPWMLVWDGYKVVSETQSNGDVWYSVVPE